MKFKIILIVFISFISFSVFAYEPTPIMGNFHYQKQLKKNNESQSKAMSQNTSDPMKIYERTKQQMAPLQKEAQKEALKQANLTHDQYTKLQKKNQQNMSDVISGKGSQNSDQNQNSRPTSSTSSKSQLPTCNCYDLHSPYTYASNFLMDSKGQRYLRKNPPCKCLPKKSTSKKMVKKPQLGNNRGSLFNIKY